MRSHAVKIFCASSMNYLQNRMSSREILIDDSKSDVSNFSNLSDAARLQRQNAAKSRWALKSLSDNLQQIDYYFKLKENEQLLLNLIMQKVQQHIPFSVMVSFYAEDFERALQKALDEQREELMRNIRPPTPDSTSTETQTKSPEKKKKRSTTLIDKLKKRSRKKHSHEEDFWTSSSNRLK